MENSTSVFDSQPQPSFNTTPSDNYVFDFTKLPFRKMFLNFFDICTPVSIFLTLFGVVANILNIIVFTNNGVKDNVTVSFFALTISDLTYLVLLSPHNFAFCIDHILTVRFGLKVEWLVDPPILRIPFYWFAFVFYETSMLITVYISVVRCACVAMPLKVKTTFTVRRAIIAFIAFFISMALLRVPMFMRKRIVREFDTMTNATRVVYKEIEDGGLADLVNDIVSRNILTWTSFVIVVTCVVVMVTKLRASAKFRTSASVSTRSSVTASNVDHSTNTSVFVTQTDQAYSPESQKNTDAHGSNVTTSKSHVQYPVSKQNNIPALHPAPAKSISSPKSVQHSVKPAAYTKKEKIQVLSPKEAQVVRSVVLVAAVFITCQVPSVAYSLARRFESLFDDYDGSGKFPKYTYLFAICANLSKLFSIFNACVNICVYYNFNSRYRQGFSALFNKDK